MHPLFGTRLHSLPRFAARALASVGVACVLAACVNRPAGTAAATTPVSAATRAADDSTRVATLAFIVGTWDWARGDSTCRDNPHTLAISPDAQVMTLTFRTPPDTANPASAVTRYRILGVGSRVAPEMSAFALRGAIVDETRRTAAGELVTWDLVLASPNRYHWHRTDWPAGGITGAVVRCDGTRPLEHWAAPRDPGTGARG